MYLAVWVRETKESTRNNWYDIQLVVDALEVCDLGIEE